MASPPFPEGYPDCRIPGSAPSSPLLLAGAGNDLVNQGGHLTFWFIDQVTAFPAPSRKLITPRFLRRDERIVRDVRLEPDKYDWLKDKPLALPAPTGPPPTAATTNPDAAILQASKQRSHNGPLRSPNPQKLALFKNDIMIAIYQAIWHTIDIMISILTPTKAQTHLAGNLRKRRLAMGLTQAGLAARSGVALATLRKFERTGAASIETLLKLLAVVGGLEEVIKATTPIETEFSSIDEVIKADAKPKRKIGWRT